MTVEELVDSNPDVEQMESGRVWCRVKCQICQILAPIKKTCETYPVLFIENYSTENWKVWGIHKDRCEFLDTYDWLDQYDYDLDTELDLLEGI